MTDAYYITAADLAAKGFENTPDELMSHKHMIYSSPATLDFNSPGAKGFGVKRAGLAIPGSVMLLVAPGCCGRNTALLNELGYNERFFYLLLDDTDIVTGRHLTKIPKACREVCESLDYTPTAVMICITCVDALLGTDMERVCRKCEDETGVPTVPAYMYALTREKRLPPMAGVRKSVYSLLKPQKRISNECNILGYFSHVHDDSELYDLLHSAGIKKVRELSRCSTIDEYHELSRANFNLVINAEARYAAQDMEKRLGIPFIELTRMYRLDKIRNQYRLLGQALGAEFDDEKYYDKAKTAVDNFISKHGKISAAVGECVNADSFELALALTEYGIKVSEIYGTVGERNFVFIKKLAQVSPDTRIFSNLSPTMLNYERKTDIDVAIGVDAGYYHPDLPCAQFNTEEQPFGYEGVERLLAELDEALAKEEKK
ncbi:oxidoreductase [Ruminococcus albus SY3]|uniref:Oxidoreductase n=1 Tax=Ruminococcus albus SY3 TaxID=1341156 RepID=A0A011VZA0_RUMAL|nr:nitrogenase component 1 [Ruminococcus albus]EXM40651.1 oxidoreductase [Ruminococcus albus SY3]